MANVSAKFEVKHAETGRRSERREPDHGTGLLASIIESSNDAIHAVNLDGTIVSWNRGAEVLFGYASQEVIGKNAAILAPAGRGDEVRQVLSAVGQASAKGLDIHARVSPEIPPLMRGDAHRLRQVLTNLSANAIKFTERGEIGLDAILESQGDGTANVRFTITDTGIGIQPEQAALLFSPFVQGDASTTRKYGGTGLGLAICKQLVEMMGGTIGVDSREGQGSTFWFTTVFELPTSEHEQTVSHGRDGTFVAPPSADLSRRAARILLVEDNTTNRVVTLAQLQKLGHTGCPVINGAEAVEAVERGGFDLVLMDCHMPVMDGFEATRRIRSSAQRGVPIIAITADAMAEDRERCLSEGMNDYLAKPVELRTLQDMLAKWLPVFGTKDTIQGGAAVTSEAGAPVFDECNLLSRLMNDRELASAIIGGFLQDCPVQLALLSERLAEDDAVGVCRQAHKIKGAAASVSARVLSAVALEMEQAALAGELERVGTLLPHAAEEFESLKTALRMAGWLDQSLKLEFKI